MCPEKLKTSTKIWYLALGLISRFNTVMADGETKWTIIQLIKAGKQTQKIFGWKQPKV
jgi:hypothetical protein